MKDKVKVCVDCGTPIIPRPKGDCTTGYGYDSLDNVVCFACCGGRDRANMVLSGRATLYLTGKNGDSRVSNWPGSLSFPVLHGHKGDHNIAGERQDVWFRGPDGAIWWGVQYGVWTQICHCRRTRKES
jgi:hypothetical protein